MAKRILKFTEIMRLLNNVKFSAELLVAAGLLALDDNDLASAKKILEIAKGKNSSLAKRYLNILKNKKSKSI